MSTAANARSLLDAKRRRSNSAEVSSAAQSWGAEIFPRPSLLNLVMDPLSVTASVVGLVAAAAKAHALLETISSVRNAPTTIKDAQREIRHTEIALRSLYRFLQRIDPASQRLEMIQVDELRVVLADAMLLFSSFESILELLARMGRLRVGISWTKYSKQLDDHLGKLERYKSSLSFMLSILQCGSDSEARVNQAKLQDLVEKVLAENTQLRQKLQTSEDAFDARGVATRRLDDDAATTRLDDDNATIRGPGIAHSATVRSAVNGVRNSIMRFAFENILEGSRVYQRTAHAHECDQSIASSAIGSIFTGYSLAEISVLSVIAMPFCAVDVLNGRHYTIHGERDLEALVGAESEVVNSEVLNSEVVNSGRTGSSLANTVTNSTALIAGNRHQGRDEGLHDEMADAFETLRVLEETAKPEPSSQPVPSSNQATAEELDEYSCPTEYAPWETAVSPPNTLDNTSVETSSTKPTIDRHHSHPASLDAMESALREGSTNDSNSRSNPLDDDDDEYDSVYPCKGCGEILEEGKAFELAGDRWHLDCFRCNICNALLDSDSNPLLLGDGSLICNNCTYDCAACGNMIEDLAIITRDHVLCSNCFRCRKCKKLIENMKYARTSHGIFCMTCHENLMARKRKKAQRAFERARARYSLTGEGQPGKHASPGDRRADED